MQTAGVGEGAILMLLGMGTVFVFLATLVAATSLMSLIVTRLQPTADAPSNEEVAAMTAAIDTHRRSRR